MKRLILLAALMILWAACSQPSEQPIDRLVDIGTHSLYLHCTGSGAPVVVIDVGAGESYTSWEAIQDQLSQQVRVCAYDRAGYGQSQPGPMPRHSQQAAEELKLLLENAGVKGPYLLVGHSLGGLNMQVFAHRYPQAVKGVVLLDPPPLDWITGEQPYPELLDLFNQQLQELIQTGEVYSQSDDPQENAKGDFFLTLASEQEQMLSTSGQQAADIASFGNLPLVVIASGKANPAFGEAYQQFWIEQSQALAGKSTQGEFILAEASGHQIHQDAPDVVLEAIQGLLSQDR